MEGHLRCLRDSGLSEQTVNVRREIVVAFMNWCVQTGRVDANPLKAISKMDASRDRRRIRRPLDDHELAQLLAIAEPRKRKVTYMTAVLAGLRKSDLRRLIWSDVDFDQGTITVRQGKAKRVDIIPMHPQIVDELRRA